MTSWKSKLFFCKITRIRRKTVLSDCKELSVLEINFCEVLIEAFFFQIGQVGVLFSSIELL